MLQAAKERLSLMDSENIEYSNQYCEQLAFRENSFDKVCCLNSFHYYTDQKLILSHFHSILKPGGVLYILDWNKTGLFRVINKLIDLLSPEHINTRTKDETLQLLESTGFTPVAHSSWWFRWWAFYFISARKQT
jgi:ubiquinone/menaquinone biosynthesis C-methylase UbiE